MRTIRPLAGLATALLLQGCLGDQIVGPAPQPLAGVRFGYCFRTQEPAGPPPLVVVDGERLSQEEQKARGLRPEEIEHVAVVKPAQAIAEYGRAGEHGVILIRTRAAAAGMRRP